MGTTDFTPGDLCEALGMDGFGYYFPSGQEAVAGTSIGTDKDSYYYPTRVTFDFFSPFIAEMRAIPGTGRTFVTKGLLTSEESLCLFDEVLPDPDHPARYERVGEWIAKYKGDYAVFAKIRLGSASMLQSMGLEAFAYNTLDNPNLVKEIHRRFSEWSARVIEHLNHMDFDFYWAGDDLADNQSPWVSRGMFQEFFLPNQRLVAATIRKPWVFHSDGNILPLLEDLLTLGMSGIHPIQPAAMDITEVKSRYGNRVCLLGNIDLDHTLTLGTPDEVDREVKERIREVGPGGGYIVTSANSLTDYCKPENVRAMAEAVEKYGKYPLDGNVLQ